jgi:hypothetical protein
VVTAGSQAAAGRSLAAVGGSLAPAAGTWVAAQAAGRRRWAGRQWRAGGRCAVARGQPGDGGGHVGGVA